MVDPHRYVLGGNPELFVTTVDLAGVQFIPSQIRLSIKEPSGTIITVSGADMITASGYVSYFYKPPTVGWYATEAWVKDSGGREDTAGGGFEVIDSVIGA